MRSKRLGTHLAQNRYQEPEFRAFFDSALRSGSGFSFVDKATGLLMGSSRYGAFNPDRCEIEIGWTFLARTTGASSLMPRVNL
ncbi:MAG: hypothetical protein QF916_10380 [Gammaproteobacteria bacterium]|nr:hypothetical protein [Gammaproteobacteria bacterium]